MKEYTFTVRQTVKVTVPSDATDDIALDAAREKLGMLFYWNDVEGMEIEETEGAA